jgi:Tol biopolymer transport system component
MIATVAAALAAAVLTAGGPSADEARLKGSFVYSKELKSGFELFTSRADGTHERRITRMAGDAVQADWSPDGRRIVFEIDHPDGAGCSIALIDPDGSGLVDLGHEVGTTCDNQPTFTADGKRVLFVRYDDTTGREKLATMALDGSDVQLIDTPWKAGVSDPVMSPDSRHISFVRIKVEEEQEALFSMRPDGSKLRRLTPLKWALAVKHDWSADSRLITVARQLPSPNVLTIRPNGKVVDHITDFAPDSDRGAFVGGFSPDAKHIVLRLEKGDKGRLAVADADGDHLRPLTTFTLLRPRFIDWGPR